MTDEERSAETVDWRLMDDPANVENRNAGNGGDLVKHTVYLAVLRFLLSQEPWSNGLALRECHAGRGAYRIPDGDSRHRLLSCLYSNPTGDSSVLLRDAQMRVLRSLGCWPSAAGAVRALRRSPKLTHPYSPKVTQAF